jgi:uncharacterized protein (TIGR03382 family)
MILPMAASCSSRRTVEYRAGFQVKVNTSDDQCIHKVELLIDGTVAQTLTAAPFDFTTDAALAKGSHTIQVKSYDALNQAAASATITIGGGGNGNGGGDGDGDTTDVTGGCSTGGSHGTTGTLALLVATVFALRRRRARR